MSFFIRNNKAHKQRAHSKVANKGSTSKPVHLGKRRIGSEDDEISSDSDIDGSDRKREPEVSSSEDEGETAQEKRLRLAKKYLSQLEVDEADHEDEGVPDGDLIGDRLRRDVLEQAGKLQKSVADLYTSPIEDSTIRCRGHQLSITCVVIAPDNNHVFSGSKDCSIIKWCAKTGKKVKVIPGGRKGTDKKHIGHTAHVLCLAITSDNKFMASGDRNNLIFVWNPDTCERLHILKGHRDAVSSLTFRRGTHHLYSASHDRTIKIWNADEMVYIETLYGHQDTITGIDSLSRERAVTAGGRDGSVRIWKIVEESQLVFHGHRGSIDCISLINEEHFVSGADDNSLAIWSTMKKRPLTMVRSAHGEDVCQQTEVEHGLPTESSEAKEAKSHDNWITAVASLPHTDLVASGSRDGCIRLWKLADNYKGLTPLFTIPMPGFVNSLKFSTDGSTLAVGVGQEHRLGRWWRIKEAKNAVHIIPLPRMAAPPPQKADAKAQAALQTADRSHHLPLGSQEADSDDRKKKSFENTNVRATRRGVRTKPKSLGVKSGPKGKKRR